MTSVDGHVYTSDSHMEGRAFTIRFNSEEFFYLHKEMSAFEPNKIDMKIKE